MATSFYKICGTHVLSIRSAPRLVNSLLFLKLIFVYYSLFYFGVYNG
ncbi:recombinase RecF [Rickettsia conorii subsp. raoultii]|nr:recombinase RecF [Rickettsia conorii subsp. raoultii]